MQCPECGIQLNENQNSCPDCGIVLNGNLHTNDPADEYTCEACGEELEFISTYKQWYCYNCQIYVDLPAPGEGRENLPKTAAEKTVSEINLENNDQIEDEDLDWSDDSDLGDVDEDVNAIDAEDEHEDEHEDEPEDEPEDEHKLNDDSQDDTDDWLNESDQDYDEDSDEDDLIQTDSDDEEVLDWELESDGSNAEASLVLEDDASIVEDAEIELEDSSLDDKIESLDESDIEYDEVDDIFFSPQKDEDLRHEIEDLEPEPVLELGESTIEEVGIEEVEIEFQEEDLVSEPDEDNDLDLVDDPELKKRAMSKLHSALFKLNSLKGNKPDDERIVAIEVELKELLKGNTNPRDVIIIADESLDEMNSIEKEFQHNSFGDVSNLFHFVNSKIVLAKKIGFEVAELEEDLDNVSSLIAMSRFTEAKSGLKECITKIRKLPEEQNEIMIGLNKDSEQLQDLLETMPGENN